MSAIPDYTTESINDLEDLYMTGRCMFLAIALHRLYGYEIQAHIDEDYHGEYIGHAWVIANNKILDILGPYDESTCYSHGMNTDYRINGMTESDLKRFLPTLENYNLEVKAALNVAKKYLIPTYQLSAPGRENTLGLG